MTKYAIVKNDHIVETFLYYSSALEAYEQMVKNADDLDHFELLEFYVKRDNFVHE